MTPRGYLPLLATLDQWQQSAQQRHPGVIPCQAGCTACCHGPFDITVADVAALLPAVRALPKIRREEVIARARLGLTALLSQAPDWEAPYAISALGDRRFDDVSEALATLPCPLLDESGRCLVYEVRPMVCRLMGLPLRAESGDIVENSCPIQERFPDYVALPPLDVPLVAWSDAESEELQEAAEQLFDDPAQAGFETTIATAIALWLGSEAEGPLAS